MISQRTRRNVWLRDGGTCQICHERVSLAEVTMDHIKPKSFGGSDSSENLRAAHALCNRKRGNNEGGPSLPGTNKSY